MQARWACAALLALAACAAPRAADTSWVPAYNRAVAALQGCRGAYDARRIETRMQAVECSQGRILQELAGTSYPNMDLVQAFIAFTISNAREVDAGRMSDAEANQRETELFAALNTEAQRRR